MSVDFTEMYKAMAYERKVEERTKNCNTKKNKTVPAYSRCTLGGNALI